MISLFLERDMLSLPTSGHLHQLSTLSRVLWPRHLPLANSFLSGNSSQKGSLIHHYLSVLFCFVALNITSDRFSTFIVYFPF